MARGRTWEEPRNRQAGQREEGDLGRHRGLGGHEHGHARPAVEAQCAHLAQGHDRDGAARAGVHADRMVATGPAEPRPPQVTSRHRIARPRHAPATASPPRATHPRRIPPRATHPRRIPPRATHPRRILARATPARHRVPAPHQAARHRAALPAPARRKVVDRAIAHLGRWWIAGFITFGKAHPAHPASSRPGQVREDLARPAPWRATASGASGGRTAAGTGSGGRPGTPAASGTSVVPPVENTLSDGPSAVAAAFRCEGCSALSFHWPVLSRRSSTCAAVTVSAGVNAQCPARCTKIWRSSAESPARRTTLA